MKREMICIVCPKGCTLTVQGTMEKLEVSGNSCPKGLEYGLSECLHPMRTLTATVRVSNRENTMASVKTSSPIPREKMMDLMKLLRETWVCAPVKIGDILLRDVAGADVIITKAVD